jgi:thioredoxin 2
MIIRCANCNQKNRIPAARIVEKPTCGQCGAALKITGVPVSVDAAAFRDLVDHSPLPVLVDFWAAWCGPCRMVAPEVDKLARNLEGKVLVAKVDTEQEASVAQQEGVRGIPMFALYKGGARVATQTGYMNAEQLARAFGLS